MLTFEDVIINNGIHVDFNEEVLYDYDELYDVNFMLIGNDALYEASDNIRKEKGFIPFLSHDGEFGKDYDPYGIYNFYFGLNKKNKYKVGATIVFTIISDYAYDDGEEYYIDLSLEEQKCLSECIDREFRMELGKSIDDILAEAEVK